MATTAFDSFGHFCFRLAVMVMIGAMLVTLTVAVPEAEAEPRSDCRNEPNCQERPLIEWSSWLHLGGHFGNRKSAVHIGGGAHATVGLDSDGDIRLGPWAHLDTLGFGDLALVSGFELQLGRRPESLDMFQWAGEGQLGLRAGLGRVLLGKPSTEGGSSGVIEQAAVANQLSQVRAPESRFAEFAITYGYRTSWRLRSMGRDCRSARCLGLAREQKPTRYMIGARLYASAKRSLDGEWWSVGAGIEFEPAGALRYLLLGFGFDDWYDRDLPWVRSD